MTGGAGSEKGGAVGGPEWAFASAGLPFENNGSAGNPWGPNISLQPAANNGNREQANNRRRFAMLYTSQSGRHEGERDATNAVRSASSYANFAGPTEFGPHQGRGFFRSKFNVSLLARISTT